LYASNRATHKRGDLFSGQPVNIHKV